MSLSINAVSESQLASIFQQNPHALLLTGPVGIGLASIATQYAGSIGYQVITVLPEKDEKIDLEKGTITVASIRRLYDLTRTVEAKGRIIIVDYAERMAPAAQNAFLKLLEEPNASTRFILLTHQPSLLLPTITSRSQRVDIRPISRQQSEKLIDAYKVTDATRRAQLLFIAEGLPAELVRLIEDEEYFTSRAQIVRDAREFVTGSAYARLLIAKNYKDSRPNALMLLADAAKQLKTTIAASGDAAALRTLARLENAHQRLTEQGNVRLQLSALVVL